MKNLRLSVKLMGGFVMGAAITLIVGYVGWTGVSRLDSHLDDVCNVRLPALMQIWQIKADLLNIRVAQRTLINPSLDVESRKRYTTNRWSFYHEELKKDMALYEKMPKTPEEAAAWQKFMTAHHNWQKENGDIFRYAQELWKMDVLNPMALRKDLELFRGDHYRCLSQTLLAIQTKTDFTGGDDDTQCNFGKWLGHYKTANPAITAVMQETSGSHHQFHQAVKKIKDLVKKGEMEAAAAVYQQEMVPAMEKTFKGLDQLRGLAGEAEKLYQEMGNQAMVVAYQRQKEMNQSLEQMIKIIEEQAAGSQKSASSSAVRANSISLGGMVSGSVVALALGTLLGLFITRSINRVMGGLTMSAEQVAAASGQVSNASQSLAGGASEQAAAIEETSSSLEEISAMTRQNVENALQADNLIKEVAAVVERANDSMSQLTTSMANTARISEETQKINKSIDDIAFQTNLLALNAAVEAARVGEAGAGFAVVAEAVRNLAMRAADAARNTSELIEETVKSVKSDTELVEHTSRKFSAVTAGVAKTASLVGEIAAASQEQNQGIDQVNKAVFEMNRIIQQNASSAQETASSSEEMSAQAVELEGLVAQLGAIVGGRNHQPEDRQLFHQGYPLRTGLPQPASGRNGKKVNSGKYREPGERWLTPQDGDFQTF